MKNNMKKSIKSGVLCACVAAMLVVSGCGDSGDSSSVKETKNALDKNNPVTITVWNYYNGDQLNAFEKLVEDFNSSVGLDEGVIVKSVSQGDIATLADSLIDSVDGKAGASEIPDIAAVYSETAYILNEKSAIVALDDYFTDDDFADFIPQFVESGRFGKDNNLMLFPTSKSTEIFAVNKTDWEAFAADTGVTIESIKTREDLTAAAKTYYEWTDGLTPDVPEDGKALYGRDSVGNYMYIGSNQLGHELFSYKDGELVVDIDKTAFKTLWDNYYVPYINGYFGAYSKFRSEDAKTGKILALTSSSTGAGYLPNVVTLSDDSTHDIENVIEAELPFANAVNDVVVQQGASYCVLKSTEAKQAGAVEFLKWFTESDRNLDFACMSGYSPVTKQANTPEAIKKAFGNVTEATDQFTLDSLVVSAEQFSSMQAYETKPFSESKNVRSILDTSMQTIAEEDRKTVIAAIESGKTREEAVAQFTTDEYFEKWFNDLSSQINELVK